MVDYDKSTGASGTMRIRDTGSKIEFWLKSGYSTTWFGSLTFSYSSPNGSGSFSHGYDTGNTWQKMGEITVTSSGTVSWTMPASGTSSFGGPTTQSVSISRATVPPAPTKPWFENISHESVVVKFSSRGTGGAAIIEWQLAFGTNGGSQTGSGNALYSTNGTRTMTGLKPGQYYAAWGRGRNSVGWGPWSPGASFYTLAGCHVKVGSNPGSWIPATPYVKVDGVWKAAVPYVKVDGVWKVTSS
ncbi:minor tail protein [Microbacterium phage Camille]|nr:minor tail protein [Microbacterium phage Camille]